MEMDVRPCFHLIRLLPCCLNLSTPASIAFCQGKLYVCVCVCVSVSLSVYVCAHCASMCVCLCEVR